MRTYGVILNSIGDYKAIEYAEAMGWNCDASEGTTVIIGLSKRECDLFENIILEFRAVVWPAQ